MNLPRLVWNYLQELNASNTFNKVTIIPAALFDNNGVKKLYTRDATDTGASLNAEDRPNFLRREFLYYGECYRW